MPDQYARAVSLPFDPVQSIPAYLRERRRSVRCSSSGRHLRTTVSLQVTSSTSISTQRHRGVRGGCGARQSVCPCC